MIGSNIIGIESLWLERFNPEPVLSSSRRVGLEYQASSEVALGLRWGLLEARSSIRMMHLIHFVLGQVLYISWRAAAQRWFQAERYRDAVAGRSLFG